jgi:hypothetical protein
VAEETVAKITEACTHSELQTERLELAAARITLRTKDFVEASTIEAQQMMDTSYGTLKELEKTRNALSVSIKEVSAQLDNALSISKSYSNDMRTQAKIVAKTSVESAEGIVKAGDILRAKAEDITKTATQSVLKIGEANSSLEKEAKFLRKISSDVVDQTEEATRNFDRQSDILRKAIQNAQKSIADIQGGVSQAQRDAFLASAKFVLESLFSLSVDLTRGLNGEVSEKMWKAFNKGDTSVFTRRLSETKDAVSLKALNDKYLKDGEFRSYVQRYFLQFEEIYAQASDKDQGAILTTTFASSDVARLYKILCEATGHKDVTTQLKAA